MAKHAQKSLRKQNLKKLTVLTLVGLLLSSGAQGVGSVFSSVVAHAVSLSSGIWWNGVGVGAFAHSSGAQVYCLEMGRASDGAGNPALGATSNLPAFSTASTMVEGRTFSGVTAPELSGDGLRKLNYVISKYGSTTDNVQAAAVQLAVWELRTSGASSSYLALLQYWKELTIAHGGSSAVSLAANMVTEAGSALASANAPADPRIIELGAYFGQVRADAGTTRLTITNGIFLATGTNTITFSGGLATQSNIDWVGQPPASENGWERYYTVTITGEWQKFVAGATIQYGWAGGINQAVGRGNGSWQSGTYAAQYTDPDLLWSPVLTTNVPSEFVQVGEQFSDSVTFDVAEGSEPWYWQLRPDGSKQFAPIIAKGTLYGPYLSDPKLNPSAEPPAGSPVAATAEIRTDSATGPGVYEVTTENTSQEAGYYSWVWRIKHEDQLESVANPPFGTTSLPVNYYFTDGFGKSTEGQITPSDIRFTTELSSHQLAIGDTLTDTLSVYLGSGGWLQTGGERTPFRVRGTFYQSDTAPEQSATVPNDAEVVAETFVTVNAPNTLVESDGVELPVGTTGYITARWCLLDADQTPSARGKAQEYCDDYGVPSETAHIVPPAAYTVASQSAAPGADIHDTVNVTGALSSNDAVSYEVTFNAYHVQQSEAGQPVCTVDNLVFESAATPVSGVGQYDSESFELEEEHLGELYWIETLWLLQDGQRLAVHEGECGAVAEMTTVEYPKPTPPAKLTVTGADPGGRWTPLWVGIGAATLGAALIVLRRRQILSTAKHG